MTYVIFVKSIMVLIDYFSVHEKDNGETMNIDLFLTPHNEAGLVCGGEFGRPVVGIILDAQTLSLTLEMGDGETFHLNIPVEETHREKLLFSQHMFIGFLDGKMLADSYEVPLLYLNDPYGSEFGQNKALSKPKRSILGFEQFMKRCVFAQALHRENLGDEDSARSVLRGVDPNHMEYTPSLMRDRQIAATPTARPQSTPAVPGLGTSARPTRPVSTDDQEEK